MNERMSESVDKLIYYWDKLCIRLYDTKFFEGRNPPLCVFSLHHRIKAVHVLHI